MTVLALDIGGANIKAVTSDGRAITSAFPLWKHPDQLHAALNNLFHEVDSFDSILLTMTGELCDCFETRQVGTLHILDSVRLWAGKQPVLVWSMTQCGFNSLDEAKQSPLDVASANWHAQATHVAKQHHDRVGLLVDIGSTTTDIIPFGAGEVTTKATTDRERLREGSLIYTGAARTAVSTVAQTIEWKGYRQHVVAEQFATMSDVYTLLGNVAESETDCDTADDRPRTRKHCANRILRMVGSDLCMNSIDDATELAKAFAESQSQLLSQAIRAALDVVDSNSGKEKTPLIVLSGSGEFLGQRALYTFSSSVEIIRQSEQSSTANSEAACALALLQLHQGSPLYA